MLNARGEVADFIDVSQFIGGRSAYECVAYSVALCKCAGSAGHGPQGTAQNVTDIAQAWYKALEGSNDASNTNGMSLQAEYTMLRGLKLDYYPVMPNVNAVKAAVARGYAVILCGAETGMYDLDLGDRIPYSWQASGNHAIVISGITPDGNFLVRDTANIGPSGVRPDPRRYSAQHMQIVSATAITMPSMNGELSMLQLSDPMGHYFVEGGSDVWHCKQSNVSLAYGHLAFYRRYEGIFGLPLTNEIYLAVLPKTAMVIYERAIAIYDPENVAKQRTPGCGAVYLLRIDESLGQQIIAKPLVIELQSQIKALQAQVANNTSEAKIQALEARINAYEIALKQVEQISSQQIGDKAA